MHMAGGGNGASGAATQAGFKTDSTLRGPCDSAMLMQGTQLLAVAVGSDLLDSVTNVRRGSASECP
jgi:hypothetical protein